MSRQPRRSNGCVQQIQKGWNLVNQLLCVKVANMISFLHGWVVALTVDQEVDQTTSCLRDLGGITIGARPPPTDTVAQIAKTAQAFIVIALLAEIVHEIVHGDLVRGQSVLRCHHHLTDAMLRSVFIQVFASSTTIDSMLQLLKIVEGART